LGGASKPKGCVRETELQCEFEDWRWRLSRQRRGIEPATMSFVKWMVTMVFFGGNEISVKSNDSGRIKVGLKVSIEIENFIGTESRRIILEGIKQKLIYL
jgi:hypothetical protein